MNYLEEWVEMEVQVMEMQADCEPFQGLPNLYAPNNKTKDFSISFTYFVKN